MTVCHLVETVSFNVLIKMLEESFKLYKLFRMEKESPDLSHDSKSIEVQSKNTDFNNPPLTQSRSKYILTDFFTSIDQVRNPTFEDTPSALSKIHRFLTGFNILNPSVWVVLIVLGLVSSIVAFFVDYFSEQLMEIRGFLASTESGFVNFLIWMG